MQGNCRGDARQQCHAAGSHCSSCLKRLRPGMMLAGCSVALLHLHLHLHCLCAPTHPLSPACLPHPHPHPRRYIGTITASRLKDARQYVFPGLPEELARVDNVEKLQQLMTFADSNKQVENKVGGGQGWGWGADTDAVMSAAALLHAWSCTPCTACVTHRHATASVSRASH